MKKEYYIAISGIGILFVGAGILGYKIYLNKRDEQAAHFMSELDTAIEPNLSVERNFSGNCQGLPNSIRLTDSVLKQKAKTINDAFGFFNDDEEAIYNTIRSVASKEQFCQLTNKFRELYDIALQDKIEEYLSSEEVNKILTIIEAKPEYTL